jgi:hypothetical protein
MNIPSSAYPLTWPEGWPKPADRERAKFGGREKVQVTRLVAGQMKPVEEWRSTGSHSIETARKFLFAELERLGGVERVVISSNLRLRVDGMPSSGQGQPKDPSVAVYFMLKGKPHVLACGKWDRAQDNIWAIAKDIEATRGKLRWGVGTLERAFSGYTAIPEKTGGVNWWEVLEIDINASEEQVREAYARLAKKYHPDGSEPHSELFLAVTEAYKMATGHKVANS